jgi:tetratricopeptide (TPR) repeat protein
MKRKCTYLVAALALGVVAIASTGCQKLKARDNLNKGVQAFKNAKYSEAVEKFKTAVDLDPTFTSARLYLAVAYYQQYVPGADSPENLKMLNAGREQFLKVLEEDPNNLTAVQYMAQLNFNESSGLADLSQKLAKLDESKKWYQKLLQIDPNNKEAYYTLGVIAWGKWYPALLETRNKLGMRLEDPGPLKDKKARDELRAQYWGTIDEAMQDLKHALDIDPKYDDAMSYMNLLYRERADLADTPEEYKADIQTADKWLDQALSTRKAKANAAGQATGAPAK